MAQLPDWLGPFIERELRGVIEFKKHATHAKTGATGRFADDGSNFYSFAKTAQLPQDAKLQIVRVLGSEETANILVSDGVTQARAILSKDVTSELEAEIGEPMSADTVGDVLNVRDVTTVSTPMGPEDEFVTLKIMDAQYLYHLRKVHEKAEAVERRKEVYRLICEDFIAIRQRKCSDEGDPPAQRVDVTSDDGETDSPSQLIRRRRPGSQQESRSSGAFATQPALSRIPAGPTLVKDGFELEKGVNLQQPQSAIFRSPSDKFSRSKDVAVIGRTDPAKILELMNGGKRKADDMSPAAGPQTKAPHVTSALSPPTQSESVASSPLQTTPKKSVSVLTMRSNPASPAANKMPIGELLHSASKNPVETTARRQQLLQPTSGVATLSSISNWKDRMLPPSLSIRRQRIPRTQQKLLDQQSSWFPSLPGKTFPQPNVPIELLDEWNTAATAATAAQPAKADFVGGAKKRSNSTTWKTNAAKRGRAPELSRAPGLATIDDVINLDGAQDRLHTSEEVESEESSLPESDDDSSLLSGWDKTPSQRQPDLPPDSSINSNAQASPTVKDSRPLLPPDSYNETLTPKVNATADRSTSIRTPHALPPKPQWILSQQSPQRGVRHRSSQLPSSSKSSPHLPPRPSQQTTTSQAAPDRASPRIAPSSRVARGSESRDHPQNASSPEVVRSDGAAPVGRQSRPSSHNAPNVVPVTPMIRNQSPQDELELSVPRTVEEDPAVAYRLKRREHFAEAKKRRRMDWLKQNWDSDHNFARVYSAYKKVHPHDAIRLSQFSEELNVLRKDDVGPRRERPGSANNVESLPLRVEASADLAGAADESPGHVPHGAPAKRSLKAASHVNEATVSKRLSGASGVIVSESPVFMKPNSSVTDLGSPSIRSTPPSRRRLPWDNGSSKLKRETGQAGFRSEEPEIAPSIVSTKHTATKAMPIKPKLSEQPFGCTSGGRKKSISLQSEEDHVLGGEPDPIDGTPNRGDNRSMVFAEFAEAWKKLRAPGSVEAVASGRDGTNGKKQLHVLSWEL